MANLSVSYEEMKSAADRLVAGEEDIKAKLNELRSFINGLVHGGFVTDSASKTFDETYQRFTTSTTEVVASLTTLGTYLRQAADTLQQTDQQLAAGLG
ncbi:MAG: WXG100 family type VII secretion target [Bifidobacteriaceae bacterium]|jgi:WXG100 family type VII secretion target|nr:WXG100 family type VII secretion target [Bifidobacteriaceae bacterium]